MIWLAQQFAIWRLLCRLFCYSSVVAHEMLWYNKYNMLPCLNAQAVSQ